FLQRADGSAKGDWDVGITIDIMEQAPSVDRVVLASGDGDFAILADHIRARHGCQVEVYGVAPLTAAALMRAADDFIPIEGDLLLG
ncbi:MAG TPA: nuclease, partial [Alcanivorax sp.]|nr:nuclease [Alcanivorax sp.]HBS14284.1 nuclease [Alcanivorax sp.]HCM65483.1 nuclease [Alcanivorax sp.]HCQ37413.1 nuclease [Alcanivorax sp.]